MAVYTSNIDSFSVNVTTSNQTYNLQLNVPSLSDITITSQTLQIYFSSPSKGKRTITVNNISCTTGINNTINLGTTSILNSVNIIYYANKNGIGEMQVSNIVYTLEYEVRKPIIEIISQDKTKIGVNDICTVSFRSDMDLSQWEARATMNTIDDGHGVGLLVEYGTHLTAGETCYVYVETSELSNGDYNYRIDIYGCSENGVWSDG